MRKNLAVLAALLMTAGVAAVSGAATAGGPLVVHASGGLSSAELQLLDSKIQHIVIIDKENHSFDNLFGRFPGAAGATTGRTSTGKVIPLGHTPDHLLLDVDHSGAAALRAVDNGHMDRFNQLSGAIQDGKDLAMSQYTQADIPGYWAYAHAFTLDDHFFSSVVGPSFPNHLVTVAGTAFNVTDNPVNTSFNAWGCDSGPYAEVRTQDPSTGKVRFVKPCFNATTLPDLLDQASVPWKYFAPSQYASGYIWSALDAINHIRNGPEWASNVVNTSQFATDAQAGTLPAVSWLVTNTANSDHPPNSICVGESWT